MKALRLLGLISSILVLLVAIVAFLFVSWPFFPLPYYSALGVLLLAGVAVVYGWVLYVYFHYRYGRQDELHYLLLSAAEAEVSLAPILWAYVLDRPKGSQREFFVGALMFFLLPGYYWIWHRGHSFNRKVGQLARQLELGVPLYQALRATRGVASPETRLAAAIGQATGKLALCLRTTTQRGLATVWLEVIPRLAYPIFLLFFLSVVMGFWRLYILPRFQRIFQEFGLQLPDMTQRLIHWHDVLIDCSWLWLLILQGAIAVLIVLFFSATARWFCPGLGRLYRMHVRSRFLRALAIPLEAGKPVPEALSLIADSEYFTGLVRRRLESLRFAVEQGEPLAATIHRAGLLPGNMVALVQTAERTQKLPWALTELGDNLGARAVRLMQRLSMATSPASVIVIGVLVAFAVVSIFMPLVKLMSVFSDTAG
jgi:type II secretory pathway component PulF